MPIPCEPETFKEKTATWSLTNRWGGYRVETMLVRDRAVEPTPGFSGAADVAHALRGMSDMDRERFMVLACDVKNRITAAYESTVGTLDASLVHPRDIFKMAVLANAAAVLLVHNHPSGDPEPSAEDIALTRRLKDAGDLMGIPILDHVVIGSNGAYVSLAERGVI